jgi:hypothetical protein
MRRTKLTEGGMETRALGLIAFVCYSAAVTSLLAFSYSVLSLALHALGADFAGLLSPADV